MQEETSRGRRQKVNLQAKEGKEKREESEKGVKKEAGRQQRG